MAALAIFATAGCGTRVEKSVEGSTTTRPVSITVATMERRSVARTVEVVGTLRGWEEVTVGAKRPGRILKVAHDFGDKVAPGEKLVEFEAIDANFGVQQAETRYLSDLARLGVTRKQAEDFLAKFGLGEKVLVGEEVEKRIRDVPAVVQAQLAVDRAQTNLGRQKLLADRNAGTVQDRQNAENDFAAAHAAFGNAMVTARSTLANALASKVALDVAKQTLADMTIATPVPTAPPATSSGDPPVTYAVTKRLVHEGQMVKEGEALFEMVIERPLRLWANVPERYTNEVQIGQDVKLTVSSRPNENFIGTVARINPQVDSMSRTFQVEAIVPNTRGFLRPGGFAKAAIVTKTDAQAVVVPIESVVKFAGVTKIFVVEEGKARAIAVETGLEGKDWVEVSGDLPTKGQVVTSGQTMLADGTPVEIRNEPKHSSESKSSIPSVSLQLPEPGASKPCRLSVKLTNDSDHLMKVWELSNSWGYKSVTFIVRVQNQDGSPEFRIRPAPCDFTVNRPSFDEIKPGKSVTLDVNLDDGFWEVLTQYRDHLDKGWQVRAEYSSGPSPEATKYGVFVGSTESGWVASKPPHAWLKESQAKVVK